MIKDMVIFALASSFLLTSSFGKPSPKKTSDIALSQNQIFSTICISPHKTPYPVSDSLPKLIKKIFLQANKSYQLNNLPLASELYNQFINLAISQNFEKYFWQEIRLSLSHMSTITLTFFNYDKSVSYLKKALEITLKYNPNDFDNTFYFLFNIAQNYYRKYDYNNSLEYYLHVEALFKSLNSMPEIKKATVYNNIALCYLKLGSKYEPKSYLNKSIEIEKNFGSFNDLAKNYNNIGLAFQSKKEYTDALGYFNKSIFIYDSIDNMERSAFVLNNIGNLFLEKSSLDTCKFFYQKSFNIRKSLATPNSINLIQSYNNLSFINCRMNNLDSALIYNNLAIELNTSRLKEKNQSVYYSVSDYLISISDLIEINLKKYYITNNKIYLLESFALFHPTIKIFIDQLINSSSIFSANIFVNENKRFFDNSMLSSHILDSINVNKCPRTLIISETYKSLSILNVQSEIRNIQFDSLSFYQFGSKNKYCQWQQRLFSDEKPEITSSKLLLIDSLINNTINNDIYTNQFIEILRKNLFNYFNNISDSILLGCNLAKDKLLLDYYINTTSIFIHAITKSGISCIVRPVSMELFDALKKYPLSIRSLDQKSTSKISKILASNLVNPILDIIGLYDNIAIIPDETLTEIPFETLPYRQANSSDSIYLINTKNISYRFSLLRRNYSNIRAVPRYSNDFFAIAPFVQNDSSYHNLNSSAQEIIDISNLFKKKNLSASYLLGSDATFYNLKKSNLDSRIFHFATHSYINNQSSNLSFLELFPENDQLCLFLPALSSIPFRNELLILNACETGSNLMNSSTGFVSFIRSLSNFAIQNYICTLWKVYDEPSYNFIIRFYENVLKGSNYNHALTQAKRIFIQSDKYSYPLFWSPFILYENN